MYQERKNQRGTILIPHSLLDRDLASRIDCSSLGPRMLTLNFLTLNGWIWHVEFGDVENIYVEFFNVEYLILNFLTLKIKLNMIYIELNSEAKKSRYVISMHTYSVLRIQWLLIFKIRWHRFTSIESIHPSIYIVL